MDQKPGQCQHGFEDNTEEFAQYLGSTREPGQGLEEGAVCHNLLFKQRFGQCPGKIHWPSMEGQLGGPYSSAGDTGGRPDLGRWTWLERRTQIEWPGLSDDCSSGMTA